MPFRRLIALGSLILFTLPVRAEAYHPPISFATVLDLTTLAFAGTVKSIKTRDTGRFIVRDIEFVDLVLARGENRGSSLVLTEQGGTAGRTTAVSADFPELAIGQRYIILSYGRGTERDLYLPIVGFKHGLFPVRTERGTGRKIVSDHAGLEVIDIRGDHLALLLKAEMGPGRIKPGNPEIREIQGADGKVAYELYPAEKDPGTRVTEERFLSEIRARNKGE